MKKSAFFATLALGLWISVPTPAVHAEPFVYFGIGGDGHHDRRHHGRHDDRRYDRGPGYHGRIIIEERGYHRDRDRGRLSCGRAERSVERQGYRVVRARDCSGRSYTFLGRRKGHLWEVSVNAWTGRIENVRRVHYR